MFESFPVRRLHAVLAAATAGVLVAGCGMFDTGRRPPPPKPPVTLVSASGGTVTVTDQQSGSPIEMRADQKLVVRLHLAGADRTDWTLVDFRPGVLKNTATPHFEQDNGVAVYGELAGDRIFRFEATQPGQAALRFELRAPRSRDPAAQTAVFSVTVR